MDNKLLFFHKITGACADDIDKVMLVLQARGFLIEHTGNKFYLSDNACLPEDAEYLEHLLNKYSLGSIIQRDQTSPIVGTPLPAHLSGEISLLERFDLQNAISLFEDMRTVKLVSCFQTRSWREFCIRKHGPKVPVRLLEPYTAYYVKAASACGVATNCSCDGNHVPLSKVIVYSDYPFSVWHRVLWNHVVEKLGIRRPFIEDGIPISNSNQFDVYYDIYRIADYFYRNRVYLRQIKADACIGLTRRLIESNCSAFIEETFTETAQTLLKEVKK